MSLIKEFLPFILPSFCAGFLFGGFIFGNWFITYDGEKIRPINSPQEMERLRKKYGMPITQALYNAWRKLLERKV